MNSGREDGDDDMSEAANAQKRTAAIPVMGRPRSTPVDPSSRPIFLPPPLPPDYPRHVNTQVGAPSYYPVPRFGGSVYPLSAAITNTHPLFAHRYLDQRHPPKYISFRTLVEQPGVRNGLHYREFSDPLLQQEGHWITPAQYNLCPEASWEVEQRRFDEHFSAPPNLRGGRSDDETAAQPVEYQVEEEGEEQARPEVIRPRSRRRRQGRRPSKLGQGPLTATKRVKGKRIERAFVIGSEAWPLEDEAEKERKGIPKEHTKGWRVYVKVPEGQPSITTWLKKVQFKIFHTYSNPTRVVEEPPFEIEETGWGGFNIDVKLFFAPEVGSRPHDRTHFLQLEPFGSEAEQEKQRKQKMVRSELLDFIEFNEPTEMLFDLLTDEGQFRVVPSKGKGKGKARAALKREEGHDTVEFPERSTATNPYSKEAEKQLLDVIAKAQRQLDDMVKAEDEKLAKLKKEKAALVGSVPNDPNTMA